MNQMTHADSIRQYVKVQMIEPAHQSGRNIVTINAKEVHDALGFKNRMPLVCSSLDANNFLDYAQVTLIRRSGPKQGATAEWMFGI